MQSVLPKVLHAVGGTPMILRVVQAARAAGVDEIVVVVGKDGDAVRAAIGGDVRVAVQHEPLGTGDAVRVALGALPSDFDRLIVLGADTPLITAATLQRMLRQVPPSAIALLAGRIADPSGYGRVVSDGFGHALRIVEEPDATAEQRSIDLVNGMVFVFHGRWLRAELPGLRPSPGGEVYLTALVDRAADSGRSVDIVEATDIGEILGVNTRRQLAAAEALLRERVHNRLMDAGVTVLDPASTFVEESAVFGHDIVLHPHTYVRGRSIVGDGCVLGPGAEIINCRLGVGARVWWSVVEEAEIGDGVTIGPYARVRAGTALAPGVALGSFAEVKNSSLGPRTQMHHFGYVGDAEVGADVNIGAGAVTCNFDGREKHRTVIGEGAFIGSDTMLVAPVTVGTGAVTGAGSVVTRDVADHQTVVGVPARMFRRKNADAAGPDPANAPPENE